MMSRININKYSRRYILMFQEAPTGCPPRFYQSVALSVLACFVEDEDIMTDASILFNIPELLVIIENSDSEEYEVDKTFENPSSGRLLL